MEGEEEGYKGGHEAVDCEGADGEVEVVGQDEGEDLDAGGCGDIPVYGCEYVCGD